MTVPALNLRAAGPQDVTIAFYGRDGPRRVASCLRCAEDGRGPAFFGRPEGEHILVAVARFLAAHSPTQRAQLQTAEVALRLPPRGEPVRREFDSRRAANLTGISPRLALDWAIRGRYTLRVPWQRLAEHKRC
jgi:hypothetical protein